MMSVVTDSLTDTQIVDYWKLYYVRMTQLIYLNSDLTLKLFDYINFTIAVYM